MSDIDQAAKRLQLLDAMRAVEAELNTQGDGESASASQGYYGEADGIRRARSMVEPVLERMESQLTAAQQRVAELDEALRSAVVRGLESEKRVAELEAKNSQLLQRVGELSKENATLSEESEWRSNDLTADNARLRELLRVCKNRLHMFPQLCIEINAALAKGE